MKPNRQTNVAMADALAHSTSVQRARGHGLATCTIRSNTVGEIPVFPRASQNFTAVAMILRTTPKPVSDKGKHTHKELQDLLEDVVVQQSSKLYGEATPRGQCHT